MRKSTRFRLAFAASNPDEFRKTVNPRHQDLLSLFAFADEQSEINAYRALRGESLYPVRNPIIIITGQPGTGKTTLARILVSEARGGKVIDASSSTREGIDKAIKVAVIHKFLQVIITCPHGTNIPSDILRRGRVIELAPITQPAAA